jgi:hypothetical protein
LIVCSVGEIHHPVDRCDDVRGITGDDDIREHENALRAEDLSHAPEEIALAGTVEVVDGERGIDEVERACRERILEPGKAKVRLGESRARAFEHLGARVDRDEPCIGMHLADAARGLAGANAELEHVLDFEPFGRRSRPVLQLTIGRHLRKHVLQVRLGVPVPLRHAFTIR